MEVNRSPSFHTDSPLDKEVKEALIYDTLDLIDLFANDRKRCLEEEKQRARDRLLQKARSKDSSQERDIRLKYEAQFEKYEETHCGGYRRIYPRDGNEEKYQKYFNQNTSLCTQTTASRARADLARQLREQVEAKQKELERFTKPRQFSKSDNNGSESPPGERRSFSNKRSPFVMSAGTGGRRRSFSFKVEEQRRNEAEGFSTSKVSILVFLF
ncbi:PREDICTED: tubulin polyglutamylase ttll6-like [Amphimedon queenslandica]|uniref:Uncharacterized protein n=1 Tax=Amphimedon queenslandica TaxID=400682 RepID=A0AAN0JM25_AMPQE|nr:PREDICTED: tubulin polyglutamylase ttll6-like [Amphimedon queenslandica]|eukprot:XP_019857814.1 PREDICTED: tubulin polyglutamylase ttll6-like [Amphimedon queenslandica]